MKRWFIVLAAAACLLAGCRAEPDTQTSAPAAETQQSEPATQEELTELLMYEVELNERLVELVTFKSEVHRRWLFAEAFLQDTGLRFTELERDRLLRRITSVWWEQNYKKGAFNHYQFSREHPVNITLEQFTELPDGSVELVVRRSVDGAELREKVYRFRPQPLPKDLIGTVAEHLVLDGQIWVFAGAEEKWPELPEESVAIQTAEELLDFAQRVNQFDETAVYGHYHLENDIDLTGLDWEPIGKIRVEESALEPFYRDIRLKVESGFCGTFEGRGHTISGVSVDADADYSGFFGVVGRSAVIRDLSVEGQVVGKSSEKDYTGATGGFAGTVMEDAQIWDSHFIGSVTGYNSVGGFAGEVREFVIEGNTYRALLSACSSSAEVTGTWNSDGFVGTNSGLINSCDADGTVTIRLIPGLDLPISIGGFAGITGHDLMSCRTAVIVSYEVSGANRMGNFVGELLDADLYYCSISPEAVNPDWYMVGLKHYGNSTVDITVEDWQDGSPEGSEDSEDLPE